MTGSHRVQHVLYRRPHATDGNRSRSKQRWIWFAERGKNTRDRHWETHDKKGNHEVRRTIAIAHLGGATLDNEENT